MNSYINKYNALIEACDYPPEYENVYKRIAATIKRMNKKGSIDQNPIQKEFQVWWLNNKNDLFAKTQEPGPVLVPIQKVGKGDFFRLKGGKRVWKAIGYCRSEKKYEATAWDDINEYKYLKKDKLVEVGFTF